MLKVLLSPHLAILLAALVAGTLTGCDTQEAPGAQGAAAREEALAGTPHETFAGEDIPKVTLTDPSGTTLKLGEATGTPVLLNLWATWCGPCVVEMPMLDALAADLQGKVQVVTVSEDLQGAEVVIPFFAERELANLPQWMDSENQLAEAFGGGTVLPLTVLYDAEGREVWRVIGAYDWNTAEAREKVLAAVAAPPADGDETP